MERRIKNLRRKQRRFERVGDLDKAVIAKIIADFIEDYCGALAITGLR